MKIPIASQTMEELREHLRMVAQHELIDAMTRQFVHALLDEISQLRAARDNECKTTWHDHMPTELPDRMELDELTFLMGDRRG